MNCKGTNAVIAPETSIFFQIILEEKCWIKSKSFIESYEERVLLSTVHSEFQESVAKKIKVSVTIAKDTSLSKKAIRDLIKKTFNRISENVLNAFVHKIIELSQYPLQDRFDVILEVLLARYAWLRLHYKFKLVSAQDKNEYNFLRGILSKREREKLGKKDISIISEAISAGKKDYQGYEFDLITIDRGWKSIKNKIKEHVKFLNIIVLGENGEGCK